MNIMNVIILGGFLGSGKTTALMQFARYLVSVSDVGVSDVSVSDVSVSDASVSDVGVSDVSVSEPERVNKVVILENEVGEIGIDDKLLRSGGFAVNNLFSGCACCTVSGELITAVDRIAREMGPQWLIVETTGIAYPGLMRENLMYALKLESRICVLTDAARWSRLRVPLENLLRGQIECADIVLINKIDLSTEEALQSMELDILAFNPDVPIVRISARSEVPHDVWRSVTAQGTDT